MKNLFVTLALFVATTSLAQSTTAPTATKVQAKEQRWAVGPVAGPEIGVSILYLLDPFSGFHFVGQFQEADASAFSVDWQKYFSIRSTESIRKIGHLAAYSGVGIESVARGKRGSDDNDSNSGSEERMSIRAPVGLELSLRQVPVQAFTDVAACFGPIPNTNVHFSPRIGVRAVF
jgi:hypothetical protein